MDQSRIDELLLYCLRVVPDEIGDGRLEALSSSEWDVLIEASGRHGVAPLLYHRLTISHTDVLCPANVMTRLRHNYLQSSRRCMHLYHELGKVLGQLRRANIPVMVLKGAHLAEIVYSNRALRPMGDVDVLVHQDDLIRVGAILLGMDYAQAECDGQKAKDNYHFVYGLPNRELYVEVHWNFLPSMYHFKIDFDGQWERSRQAIIAGIEVSVLCPEDLLLHLCLHISKHRFAAGLKPLYDIFETIRYYGKEIDWRQIQLRSEQWAEAKCVYLTFRLARELLGAPVPDDLIRTIRPSDFDERFMTIANERIFAYGHWNSDGSSLSCNIAQLWGSKRLLNKGSLFLRRAFPSPEEMTQMYPAPSDSMRIYFYYLVRIKDLLLRHGRHVWRLLRGDEEMQALAKRENEIAMFKDWVMSP